MRKLISIISGMKSLEIIRNIIRETLLASAMLVLIISEIICINRNDWPFLLYIITEPISAIIGLTTIWLTSIIKNIFRSSPEIKNHYLS